MQERQTYIYIYIHILLSLGVISYDMLCHGRLRVRTGGAGGSEIDLSIKYFSLL